MRLSTLLALSAFALTPSAVAQVPGGPPAPPAELAKQMEPIVGKLTCTGKMFASDFGPEHPTKVVVTTASVLGGFWYSHHVVEEKTKESPVPYEGLGHFTWDAAAKKLVLTWNDNMGGRALQTSTGWQGDKLVLEGESWASGMNVKIRDTLSRSGGKVTHTAEMQDKSGTWVVIGDDHCTR